MKQTTLVNFMLIANFFMVVCASEVNALVIKERNPIQVSAAPISEPVNIQAEGSPTPDGRVVVSGKTNLPNKTKLSISLINKVVGSNFGGISIVIGGKYSTSPLGPKTGLISGKYTISVAMPLPATQPESVQKIIGKEGQYLSGSLVEETSWGGKVVKYSAAYIIGSFQDIENAEKKHNEKVLEFTNSISALLKSGYHMERFRNSEGMRKCFKLMRKNRTEFDELVRPKVYELSLKYYDLKFAAWNVLSCVSCSNSAKEACLIVDESLAKAEKKSNKGKENKE